MISYYVEELYGKLIKFMSEVLLLVKKWAQYKSNAKKTGLWTFPKDPVVVHTELIQGIAVFSIIQVTSVNAYGFIVSESIINKKTF